MNYRLFIAVLLVLSGCRSEYKTVHLTKKTNIRDYVAVTTQSNLNMRIQPHRDAARIDQLHEGMVLQVLERSRGQMRINNVKDYWYRLKKDNGITGWVFGSYLILVRSQDNDRAYEIAIEKVREEKESILRGLAGYWEQTDDQRNIGRHRLQIYENGTYLSHKLGIKEVFLGEINVILKQSRLEFTNKASFGRYVHFYKSESNVYRMSFSSGSSHFIFERSDEKVPSLAYFEKKNYRIHRD